MNRAKLGLTAGAFGLGLVTMAIAGFLVLSLGFIRMPNSNAIAPLPTENADALLSQDAVPHVASPGDSSGVGEGIKVHGDWTIDVLNPDGTLVSHRKFENALVASGKRRIARVLNREFLSQNWSITISSTANSLKPCLLTGGGPGSCIISEPQSIFQEPRLFKNLAVSVDSNGVMTMSGTATAQNDGLVNRVSTSIRAAPCNPGEFPDNCSGSTPAFITITELSTPIDVVVGQIIAVTVQISFE